MVKKAKLWGMRLGVPLFLAALLGIGASASATRDRSLKNEIRMKGAIERLERIERKVDVILERTPSPGAK